MDISTYLEQTDSTAIYPDAGTGSLRALGYVGLGLAGETSEVLEKEIAGDGDGIGLELGDVMWYLARLHRELGFDPAGTFRAALAQGVPRGTHAAALAVAVGKVTELIKKAVRDDSSQLTDQRRLALASAVVHVMRVWLAVNFAHDLDVAATLERNITKLHGRRDRGVLAGSGDHR